MLNNEQIRAFNAVLARAQQQLTTLGGLLPAVAEVFRTSFEENTAQGGRHSGNGTGLLDGGNKRWEPLADSTKRQYKKKGYSLVPTLNRSAGGMYAGIEVRAEDNRIVFGSNKPYSSVHQFGGEHTPARPFLVVQEEDLQEVEELTQEYLEKTFGE